MAITVSIDNCSEDPAPDPDSMRYWVETALADRIAEAELAIRIVDEVESCELNTRYRGKPNATNVLSFAADLPDIVPIPLLGDIVICSTVVLREAREQDKQVRAHWAHMVIHGTLHLLGYDHESEDEALIMEAIESELITSLKFPAPYSTNTTNTIIKTTGTKVCEQ